MVTRAQLNDSENKKKEALLGRQPKCLFLFIIFVFIVFYLLFLVVMLQFFTYFSGWIRADVSVTSWCAAAQNQA